MLDSLSSTLGTDPLVAGALIGVSLILTAWLLSILAAGDVEEGTERVFSTVAGLLIGIASLGVIVIGELTAVISEAPGMVAAMGISALGYLSLDGVFSIGARWFAVFAAIMVVLSIAIREA